MFLPSLEQMVRISIYRLLRIETGLHHSYPCSHRCEGYEVITTHLNSSAHGATAGTQTLTASGWGINLGIPDTVKLAVQVEAVKQ
jgi:hypothetical protein